MRCSQLVARTLGVLVTLFLGVAVANSPAFADTCLVVFKIANYNDDFYSGEASAAVGDKVLFEVQACNWHEGAEVVTAKVTMPENAQGKTKATLTIKIGGETQTKDVYLNLSAKSHLVYIAGSTKVTGDFNGDGTKEYDNSLWADGMFNGEVSFGTIAAGFGVQSMFMVQVEADTSRPNLIVDKKVSWTPENYQDFIKREDHTFDVLTKVYYHLEVKNTGDRAAENVRLVDRLPQYVRWFDDQNVGEMSFNAGTVDPGQTKGFDYVAIVTPDFPLGIEKVTNHVRVYEGDLEKGEDYASIWIRRLEGPEVKGEETSLPELPRAGFGPEPVEAGVVGEISQQAAATMADTATTMANRRAGNFDWILVGTITISSLLFAYAGFAMKKTRLVRA